MQQSETGTTLKQQYLREAIIDKGYSAEDFLDYLVSLRPDGADIHIWSLNDLKQLTNDYKNRHTEIGLNKRLSQIDSPLEDVARRETFGELAPGEPRIEYEKHNLTDVPLKKKLDCQTFTKFLDKSSKKPQLVVEKPEVKVSGGFFFGIGRTSELWYTVRSDVVTEAVHRSDNDFDWLRRTLIRLNPGTSVAPFSKFVGDLDKEEPRSLEKRARIATYFLNSLAQNELLFNTKLFLAFVGLTDYNKFTQLKKNLDKIAAPTKLQQMTTKEGTIELELTSRNRIANRAAESFVNGVQPIYERLEGDVHNVVRDFDALAASVGKMGASFSQLQEQYATMVNYSPDLKDDTTLTVLTGLSNSMQLWNRQVKTYRKDLAEALNMLFTYTKYHYNSFNELINQRKQVETEYLQYKEQLAARKLKLYNEGDRWGIPPEKLAALGELSRQNITPLLYPVETAKEEELKEWMAFFNRSCEREFRRFNRRNTQRLIDVFDKLGMRMLEVAKIDQQVFSKWSSLLQLPSQTNAPVR